MNQPSSSTSTPAPEPTNKSGGVDIGRVILYSFLLLALGAIGYQFLIANAGYNRALNAMMEKKYDSKIAIEGGLTPEMVRETLGFEPKVKDYEESGVHLETYTWFSLNPADPLVIAVAYLKDEKSGKYVAEKVIDHVPTQEDLDEVTRLGAPTGFSDAPDFGAAGGGGEEGEGDDSGGGGSGSRGGFSPATLFERFDTDKDGKISKEEVAESRNPDRIMANDTDKDGFVSLQEMEAAFAARAAEGGGEGGGGGEHSHDHGDGDHGDGDHGDGEDDAASGRPKPPTSEKPETEKETESDDQ